MMRRALVVSSMLFGFALVASAQGKISGKASCAKPEVNSMGDAGDAPGHMLMFQKGTCTWTTPFTIAGLKSLTATNVATGEVANGKGKNHGYSSTTYDNGDKDVVSYEGAMMMKPDGSGTFTGTWRIVSGTGKLAGIKGNGTFKGTGAADGSATYDVEGHYTIPKGKGAMKKG